MGKREKVGTLVTCIVIFFLLSFSFPSSNPPVRSRMEGGSERGEGVREERRGGGPHFLTVEMALRGIHPSPVLARKKAITERGWAPPTYA